jgi:hypothetical protein
MRLDICFPDLLYAQRLVHIFSCPLTNMSLPQEFVTECEGKRRHAIPTLVEVYYCRCLVLSLSPLTVHYANATYRV